MAQEFTVGAARLILIEGDITKTPADAIVNAANSALEGGGGVDGAIHRAGGPSIMDELNKIRPKIGRCPAGDAVVTGAGKLPARYVIHAVGPVYRDGNQGEPEQLASCYRTALRLAREKGAKTLTFPAISTGVYGYPLAEAAEIALKTVVAGLQDAENQVEQVAFVLFGKPAYEAHRQEAERLLKA
jgi:O-acetyl-ADP-ribose deacetylase (regulator of RNase III)